MESSVGWGEAITLQHRTGERIWECPTASSAAFPDGPFLSQGIPLHPGPPPTPGAQEDMAISSFIMSPGLAWVWSPRKRSGFLE